MTMGDGEDGAELNIHAEMTPEQVPVIVAIIEAKIRTRR